MAENTDRKARAPELNPEGHHKGGTRVTQSDTATRIKKYSLLLYH